MSSQWSSLAATLPLPRLFHPETREHSEEVKWSGRTVEQNAVHSRGTEQLICDLRLSRKTSWRGARGKARLVEEETSVSQLQSL